MSELRGQLPDYDADKRQRMADIHKRMQEIKDIASWRWRMLERIAEAQENKAQRKRA